MNPPSKSSRILFACLVGIIVPIFQFISQRQHHLRLQRQGIVAMAASSYRKSWDTGYADFSFTASDGQTIRESQKCGNEEDFKRWYSPMFVIYNPGNPNEFDTLYNYQHYSLTYSVISLLVFYPIFLFIFILLGFRIFTGLYGFTKNRLN